MSSIVVANWDLDGQASASMLIRSGHANDVFFPSVGYYWLEDVWIDSLSQYEYIYIVDMHIPRRDVAKLNTTSYVTIFDDSELHPNYKGLDATCVCGRRFSTSYLIMEYLGVEPDVDAILGMYNDVGDNILTSEYWDIFSKYLDNLNISLDDLKILKDYFNAPYYIDRIDMLYKNVDLLMKRIYDKSELPDLKERLDIIRRKDEYVDSLVDKADDKGGYIFLEYSGKMYVIVDVMKKLSRRFSGSPIIVVDRGFIPGHISIGVKSDSSLEPLIKKFLDMDLPAGGERNFLGVVVDASSFESIYHAILEYLNIR